MTQGNLQEAEKNNESEKHGKRRWQIIPPEIKNTIRESVAKGASRYQEAKKFGLSPISVYNFTKDLPGIDPKYRRWVKKDEERKMRKFVRCDVPKKYIAMLMNRNTEAVSRHTAGIFAVRDWQRNLGTRNMRILNIILQEGYFIPEQKDFLYLYYCEYLMKNFPSIKHVRYKRGIQIFFLDMMREEALAGFVKRFGSVVSGNRVRKLEELFEINLKHQTRKDINRLIKEMRAERKKKEREDQLV